MKQLSARDQIKKKQQIKITVRLHQGVEPILFSIKSI